MSEQPPIWEGPDTAHPEPTRHMSPGGKGGFPFIPAAFGVGGLVLGIIATLLVIAATGLSSNKPTLIAAPSSRPSVARSSAPPPIKSTTRPTPSKNPTPKAPVVLPPADLGGMAHSAPVAVNIPRIGVSSSLLNLGLNTDGTLQVPTDYSKAGWYAQGAYPGDPNDPPAIIVGHVDNYKGPAVFFKLGQLSNGDQVLVPRADGTTATFVVYNTAEYLKSDFPSQAVYAATGRPELRLITCTGQFDTGARSYLSNFVAYAYLVNSSS